MSRFRPGRLLISALMVMFVFSLVACKKRVPDVPPVEEPPPVVLSVKAIKPNQGESDKALPVQINGTGFKSGVKVFIGDTPVIDVSVINGDNLRGVVPSGLKEGAYNVVVRNADGKEVSLREGFVVMPPRPTDAENAAKNCKLENVFFDFDMSSLSDAARATLKKNGDCLKARGANRIGVDGHTDERGSTDYNLALGQRRADEVKRYLGTLGFANITSVSYGEERPAVNSSNEDAWAQNRRAEIRVAE